MRDNEMTRTTGFEAERLKRISAWMESYVSRRRFAGCSTLILQGGQEIYFEAQGLRNVEEGLAFERETLARIYSMTKPVTSVALMMLAEKGLFHLDAPVSEFLPGFTEMEALVQGAKSIDQTESCPTPTLHHLLTHTSGMSYPFNPGVLSQEMDARDIYFRSDQGPLAHCVDAMTDLPLAFQPGSRWEYSVGIDIIGRVIEVVTGRSLDAVFQEDIFGPLEMLDTAFKVPSEAGNRFAQLYTPLAGSSFDLHAVEKGDEPLRLTDRWDDSPFLNTTTFSGGGGLVGTIDDYARFAEMLRLGGELDGAKLLSSSTVDFMTRNHLSGDIASMGPASFAELPMNGMGFGLGGAMVLDPALARTPGSIGDFGWGGMASTFWWNDPVADLTCIFYTQLTPTTSYPNRAQLKALVHGAMVNC